MPVRDGFKRDVLHEAGADGVVEFVHSVGVVGGFARGSALEDQDGESGAFGYFFGHGEAGPASAYYGYVYAFEGFHFVAGVYRINIEG